MITKPSSEELLKKVNDRYQLVTIIARRSRQLIDGDEAKVNTKEKSPLTIASLEFAKGEFDILKDDEK